LHHNMQTKAQLREEKKSKELAWSTRDAARDSLAMLSTGGLGTSVTIPPRPSTPTTAVARPQTPTAAEHITSSTHASPVDMRSEGEKIVAEVLKQAATQQQENTAHQRAMAGGITGMKNLMSGMKGAIDGLVTTLTRQQHQHQHQHQHPHQHQRQHQHQDLSTALKACAQRAKGLLPMLQAPVLLRDMRAVKQIHPYYIGMLGSGGCSCSMVPIAAP
jgi:hypothetical protein